MGSTKRRGHGEGSIKQRADGLWEARISLPGGKRKSFYGKTRKEAQDKLRAAQRDLDAGRDLTAKPQTIARFFDDWLETTAKPTIRPKTHHSYAQLIRLHIKPAIGTIPLANLTPQHVQRMMGDMTARGLSPRTVQYTRAILRRALGHALKWGLVTRNVATLVDPPRSVKKPVQPLSAAEARRFLDHVRNQNDRLWPFFTTAIMTGLRQAELLGLRWSDVDLDAATLRVRHTLQRIEGKWEFVEPKSKRSARTLSLPDTVVTALRAQRVRQLEERLLAGERWKDWGLVFTSSVGTPLEPSNLNGRLHALLDVFELDHQGMHSLRHCFASLSLAQGVHPRVVMEMLGHSQISLTMDTYSHVMPTMLKEAAKALDAALAVGE